MNIAQRRDFRAKGLYWEKEDEKIVEFKRKKGNGNIPVEKVQLHTSNWAALEIAWSGYGGEKREKEREKERKYFKIAGKGRGNDRV